MTFTKEQVFEQAKKNVRQLGMYRDALAVALKDSKDYQEFINADGIITRQYQLGLIEVTCQNQTIDDLPYWYPVDIIRLDE